MSARPFVPKRPARLGRVRIRSCSRYTNLYSPNAMEIRVGVGRSVIVDDNVHSLNINTASKDVRRHEDTFLKVLKLLVPRDTRQQLETYGKELGNRLPFLLGETRVHRDAGKAAFPQEFVELDGASDTLDENDNLIEVEGVEEVV